MKDYIAQRAVDIASYMLKTKCTVRDAATRFNVSKSTVHKDIVERLPHIKLSLAMAVRSVLDENKSERHIRGGQATKTKYLSRKNAEQN